MKRFAEVGAWPVFQATIDQYVSLGGTMCAEEDTEGDKSKEFFKPIPTMHLVMVDGVTFLAS